MLLFVIFDMYRAIVITHRTSSEMLTNITPLFMTRKPLVYDLETTGLRFANNRSEKYGTPLCVHPPEPADPHSQVCKLPTQFEPAHRDSLFTYK